MPAGKTYIKIASQTLGSATSSVTFSNLPQNYTDLVIVMSYQRSVSGNGLLRFNSDTGSNYSYTYLLGDGSSASSSRGSNTTSGILSYDSANLQETCLVNIFNYANTTTNKSFFTRGNDTGLGVITYMNLWRSTSAITSIELRPNSGNWNSGSTFTIYGIECAKSPYAEGGDKVYSTGTHWVHEFHHSGTFVPRQSLTCDYLVVAGGGGSTAVLSGGGGGGGLRSSVSSSGGGNTTPTGESALSLSANTGYIVTVGAGGAGLANANGLPVLEGRDGTSSSISGSGITTVTSTGGGGGNGYFTFYFASRPTGRSGGSGGGGGASETGNQNGLGGSGTANQGYAGGDGRVGSVSTWSAGGGGGAGAAGAAGGSGVGGAGGNGAANSITGSSITYAGGGGGGTGHSTSAGTGGTGGSGGGGRGGNGTSSGTAGTSGSVNTGGGAGGGGNNAQADGKNGGSGIVIVRYAV